MCVCVCVCVILVLYLFYNSDGAEKKKNNTICK